MRRYPALLLGLLLAPATARAADLVVELRGIQAAAGQVRVGLSASEGEFPEHATRTASLPAAQGAIRAVFTDLPPGRYAIAAFIDPDNSGKLATGLFGIPTEAYGFSNNVTGSFGPPSWRRASFILPAQGATITVDLR